MKQQQISLIRSPLAAQKVQHILRAAPLYLAQVVAAIFPLVISPLIIRRLGIETFGLYASLLTVSQIVLLISEYSFDALGPRLLAACPDERRVDAEKEIYLEVLVAKVPLILFAVAIGSLVATTILRRAATPSEVAGLVMLALGTAAGAPWYLLSTARIWLAAWVSIATKAATVVASLGLLYLHAGDGRDFFFAVAVPTLISGAFIAAFNIPRRFRFRLVFQASLKHIRKGLHAFLGSSAGALQNSLGVLLIGTFSGSVSLGIYTAIDRIARTLSAAAKPFFQIMYPTMARLYAEDQSKARDHLTQILRGSLIVNALAVAGAVAFGRILLEALFGAEIALHHLVLTLLIVWLTFGIANNILGIQGILASGRDLTYSVGIWLCIVCTCAVGLLASKQAHYASWVAGAVAFGEFIAFCYYAYNFRRRP